MKTPKLLLLGAVAAMALASCDDPKGNVNPKDLPDTNEEIVKTVASMGGIAITTLPLVAGESENNTISGGTAITVATSWTVAVWANGQEMNIDVPIAWTITNPDSWTIKDVEGDEAHKTYTAEAPAYDAEEDLKSVLTATITWADATETVVYNIKTPRAPQPIEYKSVATVYDDFFNRKTLKAGTTVKMYGYITGWTNDYKNVYMQSGEYAVQLYGATAFSDLYTKGNLVAVTGNITNYYGLELEKVTKVEAYTGTDVPAVTQTVLTEDIIKTVTKNGTKWDNSYVKVEAAFKSMDAEKTKIKMTVGTAEIEWFLGKKISSELLAQNQALLEGIQVGDKLNLEGLVSWYGKTETFQIVAFNPHLSSKAAA